MSDSPEARRDAAIADVVAAGGVILAEPVPLATAEDPRVVAAYRLTIGAPDLATRSRLAAVRADTEADTADLVDWTPEPEPEPVYPLPEEGPIPEEA